MAQGVQKANRHYLQESPLSMGLLCIYRVSHLRNPLSG